VERNRSYWRKGRPRSEGLVLNLGVAPEEMLAGLRAGRFVMGSDLVPGDAEALRREPEFASGYRETPRLGTYYVSFNTRRGPLKDRALRQRLVQAVDVPRPWTSPSRAPDHGADGHPGPRLHLPRSPRRPSSLSRPRSPPSAALEGTSNRIELTAAVHPQYVAGYAALTRELVTAFDHVGVNVRVVSKTVAEYVEAASNRTVDIVIGRWGDYPDADSMA
jgi:hypothetical protein